MKIAGNLDMLDNVLKNVVLHQHTEYPANPKVGSFALIEKRLMICVDFDNGSPLWIPLSQELDTYTHSQDTDSSVWTVQHNLGSSTVMVQAFDVNNKVILPDEIDLSVKDTAVITFAIPIQGRAIVMLGNFIGLAKPEVRFEQSFTSNATWVVNHGLGYEPIVRVIKDGVEVQPQSVTHTTTTTATVVFTSPQSGKVICT